ncbi:hypothetical protein AAFF_G00359690 [Aldrovandia affinis]|uniref:Uncharacterized protein n=1 Tax=Aldrovandia affinis TaxID=143900 RepID=A0AAD7SIQ9_9TELE|nr:hypothetical protein AAFF_G00359690 [Aldrovandia affinis]
MRFAAARKNKTGPRRTAESARRRACALFAPPPSRGTEQQPPGSGGKHAPCFSCFFSALFPVSPCAWSALLSQKSLIDRLAHSFKDTGARAHIIGRVAAHKFSH